jgi:TetR/AcrR family transcriptional repressor of lmrAB and yxaGH operons
MVEAAVKSFQRHGYHATSWRTLVAAAGTPWGSVQHHFPGGKEELGIAAVELGGAITARNIRACLDGAASVGAAVERLFAATAAWLAASDYKEGCPIATVALEADSVNLGQACERSFVLWRTVIADALTRAGLPTDQASDLSMTILAAYEGALLLARTSRDSSAMRRPGSQLGRWIDAEVTSAGAR